ncbi:rhomboid family intramembrane serine protease [Paenibacillus cookii]|uniref:rhomboid family intramembrane serine protease n=1 Tax=Paenibacillus TaxID=44249 RepID=UPI0005438F9E|nr:Rhomboid protease GlpG [Paenibacillus sp. P1XP2]
MNIEYGNTLKEFRTLYPVTFYIIAINTCLFFITVIFNGIYGVGYVQSVFGITSGRYEPWRFVTYAFLHNGTQHYLSNNLFLYIMSPLIEYILGRSKFMIFILMNIVLTPMGDFLLLSTNSLVGSSGICFGIMAVYYCLMISKRVVLRKQTVMMLVVWSVLGWGSTFLMERISISGHITGFIWGLLFSLMVFRKNDKRHKSHTG